MNMWLLRGTVALASVVGGGAIGAGVGLLTIAANPLPAAHIVDTPADARCAPIPPRLGER